MSGSGTRELSLCKDQKEKKNSQGKDPRTFEENRQGGVLLIQTARERTQEPLQNQWEGGEVLKKWKEKKGRKERKRTEEEAGGKSARKGSQVFLQRRGKRKRKKSKAERVTDVPERDKSVEIWKMALSPSVVGAELDLCQCLQQKVSRKGRK